MQEAAAQETTLVGQISFKGAVDTLRQFSSALNASRARLRIQQRIIEEVLTITDGKQSKSEDTDPSLERSKNAQNLIPDSPLRGQFISCRSSEKVRLKLSQKHSIKLLKFVPFWHVTFAALQLFQVNFLQNNLSPHRPHLLIIVTLPQPLDLRPGKSSVRA